MDTTPRTLPVNTTPGSPSLDAVAEADLLRRIDAGALARAALAGHLRAPRTATAGDLAALARDGDHARDCFVEANLGLVWFVVAQVSRLTGLDRHELFQEGMVGLLESITRFEPERGRFASIALPRIRMRIWDAAVTEHGALGLPVRRARRWRRVLGARGDLETLLARAPRVDEIARATGETEDAVRALLAWAPAVRVDREDALDRPDERPVPGADAPGVRRLLRRLDDLDLRIIAGVFGLDGPPRSHLDLARETGRSESTVRRRERAALALLRAGASDGLAA